ncbi:RagB/SusD family nutrient uptake outer membrane protein [Carboxylicivirga linearis]|uniref:RagB/SusD family nutrient uptake outer membrane protein n=1 Tax=Carboxylicivirga linearis TaxID=1628157 RepID=A0ABS5JYR4_9BACT|nr:RagB/SusD family nutrient uptake outer membrane protein [Carboxylicivirga linearis]MBS2099624.1 RagB/SusD family nutrient uptake outer membrane protein [Carboxylicivirga linearis]
MKRSNCKKNRLMKMKEPQYKRTMKIRTIYSLLWGLILSVSFTSCSNWLDLKPESDQVLEDFWKTESQVNQVMNACYRSMLEYDYLDRAMVWGELRSDNVTFGSQMEVNMYLMINVDITSSNAYARWAPMYRTINYCNNWLYFAPGVMDLDPNFTSAKYQFARAEVLTIRALSYFYLVRTFENVPWVDTPSIDDTQDYNVPQSTEDEVLDHITADLVDALRTARESFDISAQNKGRITKNAIRTLLADIALWRNDYESVVNYCDEVINTERYELVEAEDVLQDVFYIGNSQESIFELQFRSSNLENGPVRTNIGWSGAELGSWAFPFNLMQDGGPFTFQVSANTTEGEKDIRKYDYMIQRSAEAYYPFKYAGYRSTFGDDEDVSVNDYYYTLDWSNWIVYRYSDVLLMKAEALVEIGGREQEALDLVNETFLRSNPEDDPLTLANYQGGLLRNLVLRERQREFMWEGKRWYDLMRLARRADSTDPLLGYVMNKFSGDGNYAAKMSVMDALYMPVHISEINANPNLEQNPFYEINSGSSSGN